MNSIIPQKELQSKLTQVFGSLDLKKVHLIDIAEVYDGGRYLDLGDLSYSELAWFLSSRIQLKSTLEFENFIKETLANNAPDCLIQYQQALTRANEIYNNKINIKTTIKQIKIDKRFYNETK